MTELIIGLLAGIIIGYILGRNDKKQQPALRAVKQRPIPKRLDNTSPLPRSGETNSYGEHVPIRNKKREDQ